MRKKFSILIIVLSLAVIAVACSNTSNDAEKKKRDTNDAKQETEESVATGDALSLPEEALQKGDHGKTVEQLQKVLTSIGYSIENTGKYDEQTTWAITDFQLQQEDIDATGFYNNETKSLLEKVLTDDVKVEPGSVLPLEQEETTTNGSSALIANPYDALALVNKHNALPADYIPADLVTPDVPFPFVEDLPKKQMRKVAANALEELFAAADDEGLNLYAQSGYRSYERQEAIFAANVSQSGEEAANKYSARPGESEHQSGLTMDVTSPDVNFDLIIEFGETPEGKWLQDNASEFGFIIRYPKGKEDVTEYQYEPWHLRYVGKKAAKEIMSKGITLEEYLNK